MLLSFAPSNCELTFLCLQVISSVVRMIPIVSLNRLPSLMEYVVRCAICVPFVQFKKCEKHPWSSVNFSKVADFGEYPDV